VLDAFSSWLEKKKVELSTIQIEQLDSFLAAKYINLSASAQRSNRSALRGFLRYIYYQRKLVSCDFAVLLVAAPQYANAKPPRFLRPEELQQLFSRQPVAPSEIRAWAMLHLAYFLGLRPKEISLISLDDISFLKREIKLPERKSLNPVVIPLPDEVIKAIAAYIVGVRRSSNKRILFLNLNPPHNPVTPASVCQEISTWMHKIGLSASAYWLRHTYAQNLLEADASIFEIKEMLGHDRIQTTKRYISIHSNMMREVLFNET
jgi:integrase/recombinase XerD